MKKINALSALIFGALLMGVSSSAYAVLPTIDGAISPAAEWANNGYTYYLDVTDPNEAGIADSYDIKHVILFQEYNGLALPDADDGIYLLIETYAAPSLADQSPGLPKAAITMNADFNGDGINDISFQLDKDLGPTRLRWNIPEVGSILGAPTDLASFGAVEGVNFKLGSVIEFFIPSTTGGTPHIPFPSTFIGTIVYDNGGNDPDDRVTGKLDTVVPEPSTMLLFGGALLGMIGMGFKKK